jgi:phage shock protein B
LIMMARKMSWIIFGLILALLVVSILATLAAIAVPNFREAQARSRIPIAHQVQPQNLLLNEALIDAARTGQQGKVGELVKAGANINWRDASGKTALHYAAAGGHNGATGDLLRLGADPDIRDNAGLTPLDYAKRGGHEATAGEITKSLMTASASPRGVSLDLKGSSHYAVQIPLLRIILLVLIFLFFVILFPVFLLLMMRRLLRRRTSLKPDLDEETRVQQLGAMAQKLEERMANLETILTHGERAPQGDLGVEP